MYGTVHLDGEPHPIHHSSAASSQHNLPQSHAKEMPQFQTHVRLRRMQQSVGFSPTTTPPHASQPRFQLGQVQSSDRVKLQRQCSERDEQKDRPCLSWVRARGLVVGPSPRTGSVGLRQLRQRAGHHSHCL